jgi:putative ABC transport system permease protein
MTERSEITTILQREFSMLPDVFGQLEKGTPENPAITKESVHHFYKYVSGSVLTRPAWFMDVLPRGGEIHLDGSVLGFTVVLAVVTGLLFGLAPVVQVLRSDLQDVFREGGRSGGVGRRAMTGRSLLVAGQVALAFVLLIAAGLTLLSFRRVLDVDPGFEPAGVVTASLNLPESRYPEDPEIIAFTARALEAVRSLPGVEAAGLTGMLPFSGQVNASVISVEDHPLGPGENPPVPHFNATDEGFFAALGIPLLKGRLFDARDTDDAPQVVLIDRTLADRYWKDGDPVGRRIRTGIAEFDGEDDDEDPWYTVIGVVGNIKVGDLARPDESGTVYFSNRQETSRGPALVVASELPESTLAGELRQAVLRVDPELPLFDLQPMEQRIADSLTERRAPMVLLGVFAALALLLSVVGVYGVLAYAVRQRTREIGIRVALGAQRDQVLRGVLWQGMRIVLGGLVVGLGGAFAATRLMASQLYDVEPTDPLTFVLVAVTLGGAALVASLLPSLRATRVDPMAALRYE